MDIPASIPEVTGVGGSEFTGDSATVIGGTPLTDAPANPPFWAGTTGGKDTISSALIYIPEMVWNDTAAGSSLSAGGGGVSTLFTKPSYQTLLTPNDGQRDVPDISLNASPNHDATMICAQGSCVNGFRDGSGNLNTVGGTSVGAPTFAGIVAILNQATQSPLGLGNINPTLYSSGLIDAQRISRHQDWQQHRALYVRHADHRAGIGEVPHHGSLPISVSAPAPATIWPPDWARIDANVLVTSWPGFVVTPDFSVSGTPVTVTAPGQAGTSTITVTSTNGFSGSVALTCAPPAATPTITCSFGSTTPVTMASNSATATLTISTMAPHVVAGESASLRCRTASVGWRRAAARCLRASSSWACLRAGVVEWRDWGSCCWYFSSAGLGCGGGSEQQSRRRTGERPQAATASR